MEAATNRTKENALYSVERFPDVPQGNMYVCVCVCVCFICLSLGSHLLGKVSCYILRTLKQFCEEVHLIWNLGILPITSKEVRKHPQWGSILGKKVLQHQSGLPLTTVFATILTVASCETLGQKNSSKPLSYSQKMCEITNAYCFNLQSFE